MLNASLNSCIPCVTFINDQMPLQKVLNGVEMSVKKQQVILNVQNVEDFVMLYHLVLVSIQLKEKK